MTRKNREGIARRAIAIAGAAALALLATVGVGTAAQAADPSTSNITGTVGSLTIHKHAGDPGVAGDGKVINSPSAISALGAGLDGVTFKIDRVAFNGTPIDLTTSTGWDQTKVSGNSLTPADVTGSAAKAGYSVVAASTPTVTTAGGGLATASNLPYGLYLVTETSPGTNPVVSPAQPFLVSVPFPSSTDSTWIYDVNVYPKNKLNTTVPTKTVSAPDDVKLGSTVKWTVSTAVPALGAGDTYRKFVITDQLDSRLGLTAVDVKLNGTALVRDTDYTLSPTTLPAANGANVIVTFTPAGLLKLDSTKTVTVDYSTKVNSLGDGKILNQAFVNTNDSVRETNKPQTNWGGLKIVKTSAKTPAQTLKGAEFTLHTSNTDASKVTSVGTLTTNDAGEITIDGLWVGNDATVSKDYWVKETKAPAGYVLPTDSTVWTKITVTAGAITSVTPVTIKNTQQSVPNLPLTGSTGTMIFMAGGIALVAMAGGAALAASRRKQRAAN
ncbi:SpaH/EbpB family LPXTG-anchored major pilin [Leucobacter japonicus]|uniref:SpaH/EbpB family LPXTG-anchored major pilin n=1 Tax=Leucobacter japonicus TaxID=1461259 RepID=UPI0006A7D999|nr:SpaH/EbpB family LPXTG-anchored major pilin [Leucobacter japonicus]